MIFLALKTEDGRITGKIASYCRMLGISRQGFYKYLTNKDRPWKDQGLADAMKEIVNEDECNDMNLPCLTCTIYILTPMAFHPELDRDNRIHEMFLDMVRNSI